ncbi:MAG: ABC transporter substrate-binding protein [Clostridium sp.]
MKILKKILLTGIILSLGIGALGCNNSSSSSKNVTTKSKEKKKVLTIGGPGSNEFLGEVLGAAQKNGYLEEELGKVGYEVKVVNFPSAGPAINEAFVAKSLDFADYGDLPAILALSKNIDLKILATSNKAWNIKIIAQSDSNINSVKDLEGKKVIVGRGTVYHQFFNAIAKAKNLDVDKVEVLNSVSDGASTFAAKEADAYVTVDVQANILIESTKAKTIASSLESPEFANQKLLVGRADYIKENPEAVKALFKAYLRAIDYLKEDKERAYELLSNSGYSKEITKETYGYDDGKFEFFSLDIDDDSINKLNNISEFLVSENLSDKKVDVKSKIDTSFYEEAKKELEK